MQVSGADPITVGAFTATPTLASSPVVIAATDARVRALGGKHSPGTTVYAPFQFPQAITAADPSILDGTGVPANRSGLNCGRDFVLPAGQTQVELVLLGKGASQRLQVEIDGVLTSVAGYALGPINTGSAQYTLITFPSSGSARHIRLWYGSRPYGGLRLPTGNTISLYTPSAPVSIVFAGDSITAGSVASTIATTWIMQLSYLLGIDNPINVGIGGSGYLQRHSLVDVYPTIATTFGQNTITFSGATPAVGQFINAPQFPVTAKVSAVAGSTATLLMPDSSPANASATATGVAAMFSGGYNILDRVVSDILTAVNGGPPDAVFLAVGINDFSVAPAQPYKFTPAQTAAQLLLVLQALRAAAPTVPIFVLGSWTSYNNVPPSAQTNAGNAAMLAVVQQISLCYWIDVSGAVTVANKDTVFGAGAPNDPHPVDAGHAIYGTTAATPSVNYIHGF